MGSFKTLAIVVGFVAISPLAIAEPPAPAIPDAPPTASSPLEPESATETGASESSLPTEGTSDTTVEPVVSISEGTNSEAETSPAPEETSTPSNADAPSAQPAMQGPATTGSQPPATARQYLEAGAKLHNKGRYELASRYLKAAELYKSRLTLNEQIVLKVYREKVDEQLKRLNRPAIVRSVPHVANFPTRSFDDGVKKTATLSSPDRVEKAGAVLDIETKMAAVPPDADSGDLSPFESTANSPASDDPVKKLYGSETWRNDTNSKQRGRWLLQLAREQIIRGNTDKAKEILATVRTMDIEWGTFDDTPEKVSETLTKAEEKTLTGDGEGPKTGAFNRKTAKSRLREARGALAAGELDQAEAIASEVKAWRIGFYFFDDTPEKVFSAVETARRRRGVAPRGASPASKGDSVPVESPVDPSATEEDFSEYLKGSRIPQEDGPEGFTGLPR